jgi:Cd2+/Zn2+-exporting ATPase
MQNIKLQMINNTCEEDESCSCCAVDFFEAKSPLWRRRQIIKGSIAGALLILGLLFEYFSTYSIIALLLFISVIAVSGREILQKAWSSVKKRRLDMNCLISIAAVGSFFIGHAEEGAAVIFLFFIAETLEELASDKARKSIGELLHLAPEIARVKRDNREVEIHTHGIQTGEIIVIRPGEKVPLDGRVMEGHTSVNEAPITGESIPAEKLIGDDVYAGTMNEEGYIEVQVTRKSDNTLLSRIVKLVEAAEKKKSETEKYIDRFARYYTPIVISIALTTFLIPSVFLGYSWDVWLYRALVLLVISCPCALAISTPVAMVSAITSASRHGVLIKGASFIEELNRVKAVAFDKTGTLTKGKLEVIDIVSLNSASAEDVLSLAAALESRSEHPIAKAIARKATESKIEFKDIEHFKSHKGKGLEALINGRVYYAGAKNLFEDLPITIPEELLSLEKEGKTAILISDENAAIGIIALADSIRKNASAVIYDLKKLHIRTEMLTGDNKKVARSLAKQTGIDDYYASLLPEDKVKVVEDLTEKYGHVAMVGDGVNDAPALAAASVGIAMGTTGTDVAIETADIALMHDDLSRIDYLIHLSRKTMNVVKQNVTVSIIIKTSLTALAMFGMINLWVAVGIGDMGLSLAVISNAMRLTNVKA